MAKKSNKTSGAGHNSFAEDKQFLFEAVGEIIDLENDRASVNAKIAEIRANVEARGIPKKAFAAALSYFKADPLQRAGFDVGYVLTREAMNLPVEGVQLELVLEKFKNQGKEDEGEE